MLANPWFPGTTAFDVKATLSGALVDCPFCGAGDAFEIDTVDNTEGLLVEVVFSERKSAIPNVRPEAGRCVLGKTASLDAPGIGRRKFICVAGGVIHIELV